MTPWQTRSAGQYRSLNSVFEEALWEFEIAPEQSEVSAKNWPHWPQWESLEKAFEKLLSIFTPHADRIQSYRQNHNVYI